MDDVRAVRSFALREQPRPVMYCRWMIAYRGRSMRDFWTTSSGNSDMAISSSWVDQSRVPTSAGIRLARGPYLLLHRLV